MPREKRLQVYISEENEPILNKVDEVKPEGVSRAKIIFNGLRLWLKENGYEQQDAERP